jgi:hypothetical protein
MGEKTGTKSGKNMKKRKIWGNRATRKGNDE